MPLPLWQEPDMDQLIRDYLAGTSIKQLANELKIDRGSVTRRLQKAGITLRGRSDAERMKWVSMDRAATERQLSAAWAATRGREVGDRELLARNRARRKTQCYGLFEVDLMMMLSAAGLSISDQHAVGRYNLDLAINPPGIAVEVVASRRNSSATAQFLKRTEYLLDREWLVIVVLCWGKRADGSDRSLPPDVTEKVLSVTQLASSDETLRGRYGVIGSERYPRAARRLQFEHLPAIPGLSPG